MLIPELAVNPLGTRIIEAFFTDEYVCSLEQSYHCPTISSPATVLWSEVLRTYSLAHKHENVEYSEYCFLCDSYSLIQYIGFPHWVQGHDSYCNVLVA